MNGINAIILTFIIIVACFIAAIRFSLYIGRRARRGRGYGGRDPWLGDPRSSGQGGHSHHGHHGGWGGGGGGGHHAGGGGHHGGGGGGDGGGGGGGGGHH